MDNHIADATVVNTDSATYQDAVYRYENPMEFEMEDEVGDVE